MDIRLASHWDSALRRVMDIWLASHWDSALRRVMDIWFASHWDSTVILKYSARYGDDCLQCILFYLKQIVLGTIRGDRSWNNTMESSGPYDDGGSDVAI